MNRNFLFYQNTIYLFILNMDINILFNKIVI